MKLPWLNRQEQTEEERRVAFLKRKILGERCPICMGALGLGHKAALVGTSDSHGLVGTLDEVKHRKWDKVAEPALGLSFSDQTFCEALQCPKGYGLLVWVQVDVLYGTDSYLTYFERILQYDLDRLASEVSLRWQRL